MNQVQWYHHVSIDHNFSFDIHLTKYMFGVGRAKTTSVKWNRPWSELKSTIHFCFQKLNDRVNLWNSTKQLFISKLARHSLTHHFAFWIFTTLIFAHILYHYMIKFTWFFAHILHRSSRELINNNRLDSRTKHIRKRDSARKSIEKRKSKLEKRRSTRKSTHSGGVIKSRNTPPHLHEFLSYIFQVNRINFEHFECESHTHINPS